MAAERLAGTCFIKVNGQLLSIKGGLEAPLSDTKREPLLDSSGVAGFKETPVAPYVKVTALFKKDFPMDTVTNATDMSIQAEFANGKIYTLGDGWLANEAPAKGEEGEIELEFNGMRGNWQ
ncbi:phage tail tube protein [Amantichitinum ursilacus]|uniref:Phage tail tube protein n=1 Tax=Amantichitinum ursilacus TaxID=857265 RepID=A0A0N1JT08_9NEIS|nr:phage tail tube protein [Amantichitinum ursilacus]KPC53028.1 Phage tail tube protein [Amantichitinum ursilacus]